MIVRKFWQEVCHGKGDYCYKVYAYITLHMPENKLKKVKVRLPKVKENY